MNWKIVAAGWVFSSLLMAGNALAADVRLVFEGEVSASSCKIEGLGEGGSILYPLSTVSVSALSRQNDVAGRRLVALELTGCTGSKVTTRFNRDTNVDPSTGALINQALPAEGMEASSAQVQLLNSKYQPINLFTGDGAETFDIQAGSAKLEFYAQYLAATPGTTPGLVQTEVLLDLIYQ